MANIEQEIIDLERGFWNAEPGFYEGAMEEDAVIVMEPAGFITKSDAVEMAGKTQAWTDVRMEDVRLVELTPDCAAIAYHGEGRKANGEPTRSSVASTYVRRAGKWRLAMTSHQPWENRE